MGRGFVAFVGLRKVVDVLIVVIHSIPTPGSALIVEHRLTADNSSNPVGDNNNREHGVNRSNREHGDNNNNRVGDNSNPAGELHHPPHKPDHHVDSC
jgi:hypothetical protein